MEHVTRHMIYSRFWHKFLYDLGLVPQSEPYAKRTAQGLILGPDGDKMSKSKGNVVDPNDVVDVYGADVLRAYVLFMGDYEQAAPWSESSVKGCKRFLDRVWDLSEKLVDGEEYRDELMTSMHKTIKKVSGDIESMKFNTALAALMTLLNKIYDIGSINRAEYKTFLTLLYPFAPHMTEELYEKLYGEILSSSKWVEYDESKTQDDTVEIVIQINGKIKGKLMVSATLSRDELATFATESDEGKAAIGDKNVVKVIAVPGKLVNIVVK